MCRRTSGPATTRRLCPPGRIFDLRLEGTTEHRRQFNDSFCVPTRCSVTTVMASSGFLHRPGEAAALETGLTGHFQPACGNHAPQQTQSHHHQRSGIAEIQPQHGLSLKDRQNHQQFKQARQQAQ